MEKSDQDYVKHCNNILWGFIVLSLNNKNSGPATPFYMKRIA